MSIKNKIYTPTNAIPVFLCSEELSRVANAKERPNILRNMRGKNPNL